MAMSSETRSGVLYGIGAYGFWGVIAVYFKVVASVSPLEILAHRVIWSLAVLLAGISAFRMWPAILGVARDRRAIRYLAVTTCVIAVNWFLFIWAVTTSHMVEASLGYFMNPLVSVLLGFVFLGERLRRWEWASVAIAAAGVAGLTFASGVVPWVSLALAVSFGSYGLLRKLAHVGSVEGLTVETALLAPVAVGFLVASARQGTIAFGARSFSMDLLLVAAGPITALPLLWFAAAVRRLRLATVGLLQYISPTIQFTMAVTIFGEPMNRARLGAFLVIWSAIAIYTADNFRHRDAQPALAPE